MDNKIKLLHLLDKTSCLSKKQLLNFIHKKLHPEELRAIEQHLIDCPLCNDAVIGLNDATNLEAILNSLTPPVVKVVNFHDKSKSNHTKVNKNDEITLKQKNVTSSANIGTNAPVDKEKNNTSHKEEKKGNRSYKLRNVGIAACIILAFGILWYFQFGNNDLSKQIAQQTDSSLNREMLIAENMQEDVLISIEKEDYNAINKSSVVDSPKKESLIPKENRKVNDSVQRFKEETAPIKQDKEIAKNNKIDIVSEPIPATTTLKTKEDNGKSEQEIKKVSEGQLQSSKEVATEIIESDYDRGLRFYKQQEYSKALLYLKDAENNATHPNHWDAVYYSGMSNKHLKRRKRAIRLFEKIIEAGAPQKTAAQEQLKELKQKNTDGNAN